MVTNLGASKNLAPINLQFRLWGCTGPHIGEIKDPAEGICSEYQSIWAQHNFGMIYPEHGKVETVVGGALKVIIPRSLIGRQDPVSTESAKYRFETLTSGTGPLNTGALGRNTANLGGISLLERANGRKGGRLIGGQNLFRGTDMSFSELHVKKGVREAVHGPKRQAGQACQKRNKHSCVGFKYIIGGRAEGRWEGHEHDGKPRCPQTGRLNGV